MKLTFLGTGAADHLPGNSDYRRNTSTLIDDLLIDGGATIDDALRHAGVDPRGIHHLIYSHSHDDHYSKEALRTLVGQSSALRSLSASPVLQERIRREEVGLPGIALETIRPGQSVKRGGKTVDVYEANHGTVPPPETPLNFAVEDESHRVLIFNDTALPYWHTVEALKRGRPAHVLVMDATNGMLDDDWRMFEHCSIAQVARIASCWRELGILREDAQVFCTHLSWGLLGQRPPSPEELDALGVRLASEGGVLRLDGDRWQLVTLDGRLEEGVSISRTAGRPLQDAEALFP